MSLNKSEMKKSQKARKEREAITREANSLLVFYIQNEIENPEFSDPDFLSDLRKGKLALQKGDYGMAADALESAAELWNTDFEKDEVMPVVKSLKHLARKKRKR